MANPYAELRLVTDRLDLLARRLTYRSEQLSDVARRLRHVSRRPTFVAPAGDRSRAFTEAQARRLDRLARSYGDLARRLTRLSGTLRPRPQPRPLAFTAVKDTWTADIDWDSAQDGVAEVVRCCPGPGRPAWDWLTADDDPEIGSFVGRPMPRPRPHPRNDKFRRPTLFMPPPRPVVGTGQKWVLDIDAIRRMTSDLRSMSKHIADVGAGCAREFDDPHPSLPAHLRAAVERAGMSTNRVCSDVAERLRRHAAAIDRKMATPGLLGPGPQYGLTAFGIDVKHLPMFYPINRSAWHLLEDSNAWHDRARELHAIMQWLCRRLPIVYGTAAQDFLDTVGATEASTPPSRPLAPLPPLRYPIPPGMAFTKELFTDPATGVMMGQAEYYQRYGYRFRDRPRPWPWPLLPPREPRPPTAEDTFGSEPPPPAEPPGRLPPIRYPVPPDVMFAQDLITDPATGIAMSREEYYRRYGVFFGEAVAPDAGAPSDGFGASLGDPPGDADSDPPALLPDDDATADTGGGGLSASEDTWTADPDTPMTAVDRPTPLASEPDAAREAALVEQQRAGGSSLAAEGGSVRTGTGVADLGSWSSSDSGSGWGSGGSAAGGWADPGAEVAEPVDPVVAAADATVPTDVPPRAEDGQLKKDTGDATRIGGVRVTAERGAALGSVLAAGGAASVVVTKRQAAKKITSWAKYKALGGLDQEQGAEA